MEACGDPYHITVNNTPSTSMPDILYHPLETGQLTQASAHSLHQLPQKHHPMRRPAPYTTTLFLHAQLLSCLSTQPSHSFSQHDLKHCREDREIVPAPPDRSKTGMLEQPVSLRGDRSTNDQQTKDAAVRVPGKQ